jgi:2-polyprenyl-3-methyl-5-hydroxy-6-metoxy-1,4-benzoquinol methylase
MTEWRYYGDDRPDVRALLRPAGQRILDVGCGEGAMAMALKQAGAAYVAGIELEPESAAKAQTRLDKVVQGSVLDDVLPFQEHEFDYIICADVLEHLPNPDRAIDRLLPLLAPDGCLVISVPNMRFYTVLARLILDRWSYTEHGIRDRTHLRIFTRYALVQMLERHGLRIGRLSRNFRLFEDQTKMGRMGSYMTRIARTVVAPRLFRELLTYQYLVVASIPDA